MKNVSRLSANVEITTTQERSLRPDFDLPREAAELVGLETEVDTGASLRDVRRRKHLFCLPIERHWTL